MVNETDRGRSQPKRGAPLAERLWAQVDKGEECWQWRGTRAENGYGRMRYQRRMQLVHRLSYELLVGPIPAGMVLDHLCRNRLCVNPEHLEPVTSAANILRGQGVAAAMARRIACGRGHPYDEANTYWFRGYRICRTCHAQSKRRYNQRKREGARST